MLEFTVCIASWELFSLLALVQEPQKHDCPIQTCDLRTIYVSECSSVVTSSTLLRASAIEMRHAVHRAHGQLIDKKSTLDSLEKDFCGL